MRKKKKRETQINNKSYKVFVGFFVIVFLALTIRIGFIQFVQGASLKESAYKQQTINKIISTKRGTIYDATRKDLSA